jgi:glycosyltransferase involved in cell wall biosynthesis
MPVRNGMKYLDSALLNLEVCASKADEILVINDGSTDGTLQKLNEWASGKPQVRIFNNPRQGLVSALNFGLAESECKWIARFDVDDVSQPSRLTEQRKFLGNQIAGIFSDYEVMDESGASLGVIPSAVDAEAVSLSLVTSQRTAHSSVLFNKDIALGAGGYREEDYLAEDLSLWMRMSRLGLLKSVPTSLMKYRLNGSSISNSRRAQMLQKKDELLKSIGVNKDDIKKFDENWEGIWNGYEDYSLADDRKLLSFRDYRKCLHLYPIFGKVSPNKIKMLLKLGTSLGMAPSGIRLYRESKLRMNYRSKISSNGY